MIVERPMVGNSLVSMPVSMEKLLLELPPPPPSADPVDLDLTLPFARQDEPAVRHQLSEAAQLRPRRAGPAARGEQHRLEG